MINRMKKFVFNLIRKIFWRDYNSNEDFGCMTCGKQMYHRYLYCSDECFMKGSGKMSVLEKLDKAMAGRSDKFVKEGDQQI